MSDLIHAILADDEDYIRIPFASLIKFAFPGIQVDEVSNGKDLARKVLEGDYAFVWTDNEMPGGNGIEAVREIRRTNKVIPICLYSGRATVEELAIQAGVTDFLVKPVDYEKISQIVQKYCRRQNGAHQK